jgi:hypothetical protein
MSSAIDGGVSLQINLAPTDLPHARHILPHQLRQFGAQVDEVVLTVDLHRSRGRYGAAWHDRLPGLRELVEAQCRHFPHVRQHEVDYSPEAHDAVSVQFFGGAQIPAKDWNGAPFYAYFAGLHEVSHRYVLHMDSDMLFGGGSQTWIAEACHRLETDPDAFACNPLAGPPTGDGSLRSQTLRSVPGEPSAFRAAGVSTRILFVDLHRFAERIGRLPLLRPSRRRIWQAKLEGNDSYELAERILSVTIAEHGMDRVDFLGEAPGMWAVHPPLRSELFYERLPHLIRQIETGSVPEGQRGCHDLNDSMIDWASARQPAWKRRALRLRMVYEHVALRG